MEPKFETIASESDNEYNLSFEVDTRQEGKEFYEFKHVLVKIDRTGKNIENYPELVFSTFDDEPDNFGMNQPLEKREGVTMDYIAACIRKVAEYTQDEVFWIMPFSGDAEQIGVGEKDNEMKQKRKDIRLRLFKRYANIEPGPNGYGYLIKP